jgi:uncharacterized ParB-like nuclease family protein
MSGCAVRLEYRFLLLIVLGGLVALWVFDFDLTGGSKPAPGAFDPAKLHGQIAALDAKITEIGAQPDAAAGPGFDAAELKARMAAVEASIAEIGARRPPPAFDPAELQARITALDARITEVGARPLPEPPPAFDPSPIMAQIAALEARIAEIGARPPTPAFDPAGLQAQIGALDARISEVGDRPPPAVFDPAALEGRIAALDARIAEVADRPLPPVFDSAEVQERITALDAKVAEIVAVPVVVPPPAFDPSGIEARIEALDAKVAEVANRPLPPVFDPAGVQDRITALDARVAEIGAESAVALPPAFDPSGIEARITALDAKVAEVGARPLPPAFDPDRIEARITALDSKVAEIGAAPVAAPPPVFDPSDIEARIAALNVRITEVAARPVAEPSPGFDPTGLLARIAELDARIAAVDRRPVPVLPEAFDPSGIEDRIAALDARISEIGALAQLPALSPDLAEPALVAASPVVPEPVAVEQPVPELVPEDATAMTPADPAQVADRPQLIVHVVEKAWIRVRDGRRVIFEGTLPAGGQFVLPERTTEPLLRAGNARSVYVLMEGVAYGPVGGSRRLAKNFFLRAANIKRRLPPASADDPDGRAAQVAASEAWGVERADPPLAPGPAVAPVGLVAPPAPELPKLDLPNLAPALPAALPGEPAKVTIHAADAAWIRVRDGQTILFEGTLPAGGQFELPALLAEPLLRAGNAGSVYLLIGDVAYGPVGRSTRLVKKIALQPSEIESRFPRADAGVIPAK